MTKVLMVPDLPIERWPSMDRYALRLAAALSEEAPDLDIALAGPIDPLTSDEPMQLDRSRSSTERPGPRIPPPRAKQLRRYVSRYLVYPRKVRSAPADIVHVLDHSYAHMLRAARGKPAVVTVHDLIPVFTVKRRATHLRERVRNHFLERVLDCLRESDAWIVATEWLRGELAEWLGDDNRIHVIPYGVDESFFEPASESRDELRRRWDIPESAFVVLHVGSTGTRKNFNAVIAAVDGLRAGGVDAWLLQVGGALSPEHEADIRSKDLHGFVRALGAAGESDLRAAYRAADVLLFPSLYEGFGFPVLEAMASELPVVTSGAGGLDEVAGDAAVVVGGREVEPYTAALAGIADDPGWREDLVGRGVTRARRFRWAETARKTADVYRALA